MSEITQESLWSLASTLETMAPFQSVRASQALSDAVSCLERFATLLPEHAALAARVAELEAGQDVKDACITKLAAKLASIREAFGPECDSIHGGFRNDGSYEMPPLDLHARALVSAKAKQAARVAELETENALARNAFEQQKGVLRAAVKDLEAELARLRSGGCARDLDDAETLQRLPMLIPPPEWAQGWTTTENVLEFRLHDQAGNLSIGVTAPRAGWFPARMGLVWYWWRYVAPAPQAAPEPPSLERMEPQPPAYAASFRRYAPQHSDRWWTVLDPLGSAYDWAIEAPSKDHTPIRLPNGWHWQREQREEAGR